jgi:hypothetical protein
MHHDELGRKTWDVELPEAYFDERERERERENS